MCSVCTTLTAPFYICHYKSTTILISRVTLSIPWHLEGTDIYHQPDAALGRDRLCQDQGLKITEEPSVRQCVEKCFRIYRVSSFTMACMGSVHHFDAVGMYCTLKSGVGSDRLTPV